MSIALIRGLVALLFGSCKLEGRVCPAITVRLSISNKVGDSNAVHALTNPLAENIDSAIVIAVACVGDRLGIFR